MSKWYCNDCDTRKPDASAIACPECCGYRGAHNVHEAIVQRARMGAVKRFLSGWKRA